jgi:hypothetical protein
MAAGSKQARTPSRGEKKAPAPRLASPARRFEGALLEMIVMVPLVVLAAVLDDSLP